MNVNGGQAHVHWPRPAFKSFQPLAGQRLRALVAGTILSALGTRRRRTAPQRSAAYAPSPARIANMESRALRTPARSRLHRPTAASRASQWTKTPQGKERARPAPQSARAARPQAARQAHDRKGRDAPSTVSRVRRPLHAIRNTDTGTRLFDGEPPAPQREDGAGDRAELRRLRARLAEREQELAALRLFRDVEVGLDPIGGGRKDEAPVLELTEWRARASQWRQQLWEAVPALRRGRGSPSGGAPTASPAARAAETLNARALQPAGPTGACHASVIDYVFGRGLPLDDVASPEQAPRPPPGPSPGAERFAETMAELARVAKDTEDARARYERERDALQQALDAFHRPSPGASPAAPAPELTPMQVERFVSKYYSPAPRRSPDGTALLEFEPADLGEVLDELRERRTRPSLRGGGGGRLPQGEGKGGPAGAMQEEPHAEGDAEGDGGLVRERTGEAPPREERDSLEFIGGSPAPSVTPSSARKVRTPGSRHRRKTIEDMGSPILHR